MKLIIEDDEGHKTVVPLVRDEVEITIGRQEGNTIRLTERNVSRKHAKLKRSNGSICVEDLGSYNGIRINGDKIAAAHFLKAGDLVEIGDYDLAIELEEGEALASPAANDEMPTSPGTPTLIEDVEPFQDMDTEPGASIKAGRAPAAAAAATKPAAPAPRRHEDTAIINPEAIRAAARSRKVVDIPADQAPRVYVVSTEFAGREFACIRSEIKIGRTEDNDVALDHRSLSRNHCKLVREESGEWKIIDLQSANGVKVDGEQYAECVVRFGSVIELGHLKFKFLAPGAAAPAVQAGGGRSKAPLFVGGAAVALAVVAAGAFLLKSPKPANGEQIVQQAETPPAAAPAQGSQDQEPDAPAAAPKQGAATAGQQPQPAQGGAQPALPRPASAQAAAVPSAAPAADQGDSAEPQVDRAAQRALEGGKESLAAGRFADAERKLAQASQAGLAEATPLLEKARAEVQAQAHFQEAQKRLAAGDKDAAKRELAAIPQDSAFALKAQQLQAQMSEAAQASAEQEKLKRAVAATKPERSAVEVKRERAFEDFSTGKTLANRQNRKYKEAIPYLERALKADPELSEAHLYLGTCFAQVGEVKRGAFHYEEFVHQMSDHAQAPAVRNILRTYYRDTGEKPRYPLGDE